MDSWKPLVSPFDFLSLTQEEDGRIRAQKSAKYSYANEHGVGMSSSLRYVYTGWFRTEYPTRHYELSLKPVVRFQQFREVSGLNSFNNF